MIPNTVAGLLSSLGEESDDDGECKEITQEEQTFYAARSAFGE